jgi:hypothetical protein
VNSTSVKEDTLSYGGLTRVNMGDDADISSSRQSFGRGHVADLQDLSAKKSGSLLLFELHSIDSRANLRYLISAVKPLDPWFLPGNGGDHGGGIEKS